MSREHQKEIVMALVPYLLAFPQSKMTQEGLLVYAKALQSLSVAEVDVAMLKLMRTCRFFPSVAEIFEQADAMKSYARNSSLPSPDEAWQEAMREAHDKFVYGKWELSTPEVQQAVDNFGKMALCELEPEGMNTARAQFMRIYSSILDRKRDRRISAEVMKSLPKKHAEMLIGGLAEKLTLTSGEA